MDIISFHGSELSEDQDLLKELNYWYNIIKSKNVKYFGN